MPRGIVREFGTVGKLVVDGVRVVLRSTIGPVLDLCVLEDHEESVVGQGRYDEHPGTVRVFGGGNDVHNRPPAVKIVGGGLLDEFLAVFGVALVGVVDYKFVLAMKSSVRSYSY